MDFDRFEDKWPAYREGEGFRDKIQYDELQKEKSEMPRARWVWVICLLVGAAGKWLNWPSLEILGTCAFLIAIQAMDILVRILQKTQELRIEVELLKGSIRENRWETIQGNERIVRSLEAPATEQR